MLVRLAWLAMTLVTGCGELLGFGDPLLVPEFDAGGEATPPDARDDAMEPTFDAGPDAAAPDAGQIVGSYVDTYQTERGAVHVAHDLRQVTIAALLPDGAGGFTTVAGTGREDGTFTIPVAPPAVFYVQVGSEYLVTSVADVDLGRDQTGRPDVPVAAANTTIDVDLDGPPGDLPADNYVSLYSLNTPLATAPTDWHIADHAFSEAIDWQGLPLIDAGEGDVLYFTDLVRDAAAEGLTYWHVAAGFTASPFTLTDGGVNPVSGAWSTPVSESFAFDWRRSQFANLFIIVNPRARPDDQRLDLLANPPGYGVAGLLAYADAGRANTFDIDGSMLYANPFPASWTVNAFAAIRWSVPFIAPGATTSATQPASFTVSDVADRLADVPLVPLVTPVRSPTIAGRNALAPQTGVGLTPTVAWQPPATGTGSGVQLFVLELVNSGGQTRIEPTATFSTRGTSVTLPAGVLTAGHTYVALIEAVLQPGVAIDRNPWRYSLPYATADTLTEPFTP